MKPQVGFLVKYSLFSLRLTPVKSRVFTVLFLP